MFRKTFSAAFALALLVSLPALAAAAPVSTSLHLDVPSSYVWRGLTLTNHPVAQPAASVGVPFATGTLTGGLWANVESKATGTAIAQRGLDNAGLAELDYSLEWSREAAIGQFTAGAVRYQMYGTPVSSEFNTTEAYGRFALKSPLSPSLGVYMDVEQVKGAYVEAAVEQGLPVGTFPLTLGVLAGFSAGQSLNTSNPDELANFLKDGLTHVDLSAKMQFGTEQLSVSPVVHVILNQDEATKRTSFDVADQDHATKVWVGLSAGWSN